MTKVVDVDDAHAFGTSGQLVMSLWRTVTTLEALTKHKEMTNQHMKQYKSGFAFLSVVEAEAEMPDAEARNALADLFRSVSDVVICSALVFEGEGFRAAAVRGITTGINLLARQPFPHKVFANVDEATVWMAAHDKLNITPEEARQAFQALRSAIDSHTGKSSHAPQSL